MPPQQDHIENHDPKLTSVLKTIFLQLCEFSTDFDRTKTNRERKKSQIYLDPFSASSDISITNHKPKPKVPYITSYNALPQGYPHVTKAAGSNPITRNLFAFLCSFTNIHPIVFKLHRQVDLDETHRLVPNEPNPFCFGLLQSRSNITSEL